MFEKYIKPISNSLLFKGMDHASVYSMLKCLEPKLKSYKKNDYIFSLGDSFTGVGVMLEGKAVVLNERSSGDRDVISVLSPGDVFGEIVAFSELSYWPNTVQAFENCKVLLIPKSRISGECSKVCPWHRSLIENFLKLLSEKALVLNKKVQFLAIKGIREKAATYLYEKYKETGSKDILLNLNRNDLADFLSVSRPSMSRELCRLRDDGIIDFHLNSFKILNPEALKLINQL